MNVGLAIVLLIAAPHHGRPDDHGSLVDSMWIAAGVALLALGAFLVFGFLVFRACVVCWFSGFWFSGFWLLGFAFFHFSMTFWTVI